jgi:hypothetical protein
MTSGLPMYNLFVSICPSLVCLLLQFAAKKLDRRLSHLGAEQVIEIGLGDDQHPSGYDFSIY